MQLKKGTKAGKQTYTRFIRKLLESKGGWCAISELEKAAWEHFKDRLGPEDKRIMNKKTGRLGWQNMLDWGKAALTKQGAIKTRRSKKVEGGGVVVLMDHPALSDEGLEWKAWVEQKRRRMRKGFRHKCPRCKTRQPLKNWSCCKCGYIWPSVEKVTIE